MKLRFVLLAEGSSDRGLIPHLQNLCIRAGVDEVTGIWPDFDYLPEKPEKTVEGQIRAALQLEPDVDLLFIHRDADSNDAAPRRETIRSGAKPFRVQYVPVIPVQELEAWLLLDESAIRMVAENPRGREGLELPPPQHIETTARPKERLQAALLNACKSSGRRKKRFQKDFPRQRARLLERLDIDGPITRLSAWQQLVIDIHQTIDEMKTHQESAPTQRRR
jgi:hypothetical protein